MAAYTSTTSGNFTASATWGGAGFPNADADTFTVATGHVVTYAVTSPVANGFDNSTINGTLDMVSGSTLRMNGTLTVATNGLLSMSQATVRIKGTNAELHGIVINNQNSASFMASGSEAMPTTTLAVAVNPGDMSASFASVTDFAVGEWIGLYREFPTSSAVDNDEGVIIHDISGNTVYFREFVSPTATITAAGSNYIDVSDSTVFRNSQRLIFGTSSIRTVSPVSSIDYASNRITFTNNLTSTDVVGQTVYTTGFHKYHPSGDTVRKMATIPSTAANSGATTLTLVNAAAFDIGDEFIIEHPIAASTTYTIQVRHTITNVSSNTLTFTPALPASVTTGSFCTVISRDCKVMADTSADRPYVYVISYTSNYSRRLYWKNVFFDAMGNTGGTFYAGGVVRGVGSTPFRSQGVVIDGCVFTNDNNRSSWAGLMMYSDINYSLVRNGVYFKTHRGLSYYYGTDSHMFNNFSCYADDSTLWYEGMVGQQWEVAYIKAHRGANYNIRFSYCYEPGLGMHHHRSDAGNAYPLGMIIGYGTAEIWQNEFLDMRYAPLANNGSLNIKLIYNKFDGTGRNANYPHGVPLGTGYDGFRGGGFWPLLTNNEAGYKINNIEQWSYHCYREWNASEQAWKFERRDDSSGNAGFYNVYYVPAGSTLYATFNIKLYPGFNGTKPYGLITPLASGTYYLQSSLPAIYNNTIWNVNGEGNRTLLTNTNDSTFTSTTISQQNTSVRGRYYVVGVYSDSSNASEGFYQKPDIVQISNAPYPYMRENTLDSDIQSVPSNYIEGKKIRLGGVIL